MRRHPFALSAGIVVALTAVGVTLHLVFARIGSVPVRLLLSAAVMGISLAIALYLASRLGWRRSGFRRDVMETTFSNRRPVDRMRHNVAQGNKNYYRIIFLDILSYR